MCRQCNYSDQDYASPATRREVNRLMSKIDDVPRSIALALSRVTPLTVRADRVTVGMILHRRVYAASGPVVDVFHGTGVRAGVRVEHAYVILTLADGSTVESRADYGIQIVP